MKLGTRPKTTRDGAAVALLGFLALAITSAVLIAAAPEVVAVARAAAIPAVVAPF